MLVRLIVVAALAGASALASTATLAGGIECATCYRHVVRPPVYGAVSERVLIHPSHTIARTIPAQYESIAEKVLVSPERKEWQVTRGPLGETIGCWVVVPPKFEVRQRSVMVRKAQTVSETIPAAYVTRTRSVVVESGRSGWEPIAARPVLVKVSSPAYGARGIFGAAGFD